DDRAFVTVGVDGTARLWDAATRTLTAALEHPAAVTAVAFRPGAERADLPLLATRSTDGDVSLWTKRDTRLVRQPPSAAGELHHGACSPDGPAGRAAAGGFDHVEFSPDGLRVLTATSAEAALWDARTARRQLAIVPAGGVTIAQFSPDGGLVVTGSGSGAVRLWDTVTGARVAEGQCGRPVTAVAFDHAGTRLLTIVDPQSSIDPTGTIWSIGDPAENATASPRALDRVTVIRSADPDVDGFFADDRTIVMMTRSDASARSGRVRLSDARTGVPVAAPLPVDATAIRVNRSGSRVLVAGGDGRISVLTL